MEPRARAEKRCDFTGTAGPEKAFVRERANRGICGTCFRLDREDAEAELFEQPFVRQRSDAPEVLESLLNRVSLGSIVGTEVREIAVDCHGAKNADSP
jgi:hypothetical protein